MIAVLSRLAVVLLFLLAAPVLAADKPNPPNAAQTREALDRALAFLLADQNPDGSWGSHRNAMHQFWSNPETHRSWVYATTGLCCMALQQAGTTDEQLAAYDRGIDFMIENHKVKRPSGWDCDNTWAYVYGLQAMVRAYVNPRYQETDRRPRIGEVARWLLGKLEAYQTPDGGWGYSDSWQGATRRPTWATSFQTAVAILAMLDARDAGFEVPEQMLRRAVRAVKHCRLPSGAYTYSVEPISHPGRLEYIDQIKGSLSRIQVCNLALVRAGEEISTADLKQGLAHFFKEHRFLDVARKKPRPHEAYYLNSGYFYFFGHYYAAGVIELLPAEDRAVAWPRLCWECTKTQEADGSMVDWYLNTYHKPYGTAYAAMVLAHSLADNIDGEPRRSSSSAELE